MQIWIWMARAAVLSVIGFLATTSAEARFLQTDPVGYQGDLNLYTYVLNDPTNKTDPTGRVCNQDGTLCTSDVTRKSTATNVQNTPTMDKAMHDNAGQVRVNSNATSEKIGFINGDKNGTETFRNPADVTTGNTSTQDNAKAGIAPGDIAVLHSHIRACRMTPSMEGVLVMGNH